MEILALLQCLNPYLAQTTLRQLSRIAFAMLVMTGRVTMLGISRWAGKGGSYRTVQRFFYTQAIPWAVLFWTFFRHHLHCLQHVYLLAGDEVVVSKAGKQTFGLDRFYASLYGKPIPGLSFFALSLVDVHARRSFPMRVEQVVRTEAEKVASKAKAEARKQKKPMAKRPRGRPKGSKNKNKAEVELTPELLRIKSMVAALLKLITGVLSLTYLVLDGHFGNNNALQMARQSGLHLISKLRYDSALYFPYKGAYGGHGPHCKYGNKLDYRRILDEYLKETSVEKNIQTCIYQAELLHKEFSQSLNVVIMVKTNLQTGAWAHVVLFSSDLELSYDKIVDYYCLRFQIEMVFMQMTKTDVFAGGAGRDHVSDFDISVCDNDSINKQFYQFSFLLKTGILQTRLDPAAKILDRSHQASQLILPVHLLNKLLLLSFDPLAFAIQVCSTALILRQRDNATQVSLGEAIQLILQSYLAPAQVFPTSLKLL